MNKMLFLILGATGTIFSSSVSQNLQPEEVQNPSEISNSEQLKSVGHFDFKVGPSFLINKTQKTIPVFFFGYQSPIETSNLFESARVEVGGGYMGGDHSIWYHPKVAAVKYLNPNSDQRVYFLTGSHLATVFGSDKEGVTKRHYQDTYIGGSLGLGLEIGKSDSAVNRVEFGYDIPLLSLDDKPVILNRGVPMITYSVGF
ncbi:MAG: hypothetical protein S4CHLAM20_08750 [Chlamydiia bacterium]|nr:hypothetical protein [Chlamydiia bacterium]